MVTGAAKAKRATHGGWSDILWMAKQEMLRGWVGYIASAAYLLLAAALVAPRGEVPLGIWSSELSFLLMATLLAQPFFSGEYVAWENDKVAKRLIFQRIFPIPLNVLVNGRMLAIVAAALLNVPAFFIPVYLIGEWDASPVEFLWFALFWTGISIALTGYGLCMEFGTGIKRWVMTNIALIVVVVVTIIVLGTIFDIWLVRGSVGLVRAGGPFLSLGSLVAGVGIYVWSGRVAVDLLRRRELTP